MIQIWILLGIGIFSLLLVPFSSYYFQRKEYRQSDWMYFSGSGKQDSKWYAFYLFFSGWKFTRRYISKIKRHVDRYYPGQDKEASIRTIKIYFFEVSTGILAVLSILLFRLGLQYSIGVLALVYFINTGYIHKSNEKMDKFLLEDQLAILSKIRHAYHGSGTLKEALEAVIEGQIPDSMRVHLEYLISVFEEEDMEESIKQYMENVPNDYMKQFMALCCTIEQFGDPKVGNDLTQFLSQLLSLRVRLETEIRIRKRKRHLFYGFLFGIAFPLYLIPIIRIWAGSSMPSLDKYYSGSYGIWASLLSFVFIIIFYRQSIRLQENVHLLEKEHAILFRICEIGRLHEWLCNVLDKNEGKRRRFEELLSSAAESMTAEQLFLKRIITTVFVFLVANAVFIGIHYNQKQYDIYNTTELGSISSAISEEEEAVLRGTMGRILSTYAGEEVTKKLEETIRKEIETDTSDYAVDAAVEEVMKRLNDYNQEYYRWYELLICIGLSILGFFYPVWMITYESKVVKSNMRKETMQMQSVLSILTPIKQMTPEIMLSWMEQFAFIFQPVIQQCMESLYDEEKMEEVLDNLTFEPMKRIVENLMASDICGIPAAFDELEADQRAYEEEQKQEDTLQLDDKSAMGNYMAAMPFGFVLFIYLIIPFTIETTKLIIN